MSDAGQVAFLSAVVSDPEMKKRLLILQAKMEEIEAGEERLRLANEENNRVLAAAQAGWREVAATRDSLAEHERVLAEKTATLTGVIKTHDAERARWEAVRKMVDDDQAAKAAEIAAKAAEIAAGEAAFAARKAELDTWAAEVATRWKTLKRQRDGMRAALKLE